MSDFTQDHLWVRQPGGAPCSRAPHIEVAGDGVDEGHVLLPAHDATEWGCVVGQRAGGRRRCMCAHAPADVLPLCNCFVSALFSGAMHATLSSRPQRCGRA
jgi:hypothetical protein